MQFRIASLRRREAVLEVNAFVERAVIASDSKQRSPLVGLEQSLALVGTTAYHEGGIIPH